MRILCIASALVVTVSTSAYANLVTNSHFHSFDSRSGNNGLRDASGDSFSAATVGFSDAGGAFLDDGSGAPVFGGTSLIGLGPGGILINIETSEVAGPGPGQSTFTFRFFTDDGLLGTPGFVPAGATISGDAIGQLEFSFGDFRSGPDFVEWTPNPGFTIDDATTSYLADGAVLAGGALAIDPAPGSFGVFSNGGAGLSLIAAVGIGDGLGGLGDITGFGIDEAIFTVTITEIPEPATLSLLGIGAVAMLRRRRA